MKKYWLYIIFFLSVLLVIVSLLYFLERNRVGTGLWEDGEFLDMVRPEIREDEDQLHILEGYLIENKVEEGYVVLRIDLGDYFVNYSKGEDRDIRILVDREAIFGEWKFETQERTDIEYSDLNEMDHVVAYLKITIDKIFDDKSFGAISLLRVIE